jgi:hypothetical protein
MSDRLLELAAFVRAGETGSFSRVARESGCHSRQYRA